MTRDLSYDAVMSRNGEIMKKALGFDYAQFETGGIAFDYEGMMESVPYTFEEIRDYQLNHGVGNTALLELRNLTKLARTCAPEGMGARILVKDEASNVSGSYKARRASTSVQYAKAQGFEGVIAATSGNYGTGVATQAAMVGLKTIVVQECFDSRGVGQPEIIEKARACEAIGAEVAQLTVGPELFYYNLVLLEETGFFNASLYSPFGVRGIETLGVEIAEECKEKYGKYPEVVIATNAGGGNLTGTARGLLRAGAKDTEVIAASVDLSGLHMASDNQFNRKSFTTGHTGFGVPFATYPDRSDVPRSAARPMRYMDRYVTVTQGSVFYITELLAQLEGMERGPAGNTSLAVAFKVAQTLPEDAILVVQETEYTGAGKHINPQLTFAKENGIDVRVGDPAEEVPGENIIIPSHPSLVKVSEMDINKTRRSYVKNAVKNHKVEEVSKEDLEFLAAEIKSDVDAVKGFLDELEIPYVK
ncbi:PLP-dependent lyase/thiolase [Peptoniphilus sp. KCTC 25270]|uniref:2-amino-4-oxopentanoate thiolase subunit OrtB n=1 Tax=Peptoniphilus sp. KCTC 25270 TaxID=2897414 RepID=UPI001E4B3BCD|nr:2-amino-4-oxopentanoate thiolase subunit OrtB [Peptoniphilus sp. KCTC 25270]MCD1147064.1 PLP-dependent lyase/thiolase [Peptoniphilus sp. KCTC 25270]